MTRRTLADLYVIGEEVSIDDGQGDPVKVWIQKMSPVEHKRALTKAGAARARKMALSRQPDTDEYLAARADILDFADTDGIIDLAYRNEILARRMVAEAELQAADEWAKDDYLDGLVEAWEGEPQDFSRSAAIAAGTATDADGDAEDAGDADQDEDDSGSDAVSSTEGLNIAYHDPDHDNHDEAVRVFNEIKRFNDLVEARFDAERARIIEDASTEDRDALVDKATRQYLETSAGSAFLDEYYEWEMFLSVRQVADHHKYYFGSRDDLDRLPDELKAQLQAHIHRITVEPTEGKDSAGIPPSLLSAALQSTEDQASVSTPAAPAE